MIHRSVPGATAAWTHFIIVVNLFAESHREETPSEIEDHALSELLKVHAGNPDGVSEIAMEGSTLRIHGVTSHTAYAWALLKELLPRTDYLETRERVATLHDRVRAPFPVIRPLGFASFTAETYLVWWKSKLAVCKCFRAGYDHHFVTEAAGLQLAAELGIGPEVYEVGPNWIAMEYLSGYHPVRPEWYKMFDLSVVRRAFAALRSLHDAGYAHFDFNPLNVMYNKSGDVRLIDFENLFPRRGSADFLQQPVFSGRSFFEVGDVDRSADDENRIMKYRTNGPMALYEKNWMPNVGLRPETLVADTRAHRYRRIRFFVSNRVAGRFSR